MKPLLVLLCGIVTSTYGQLFSYEANGKIEADISADSTRIVFKNNSNDTIRLWNVLPFSKSEKHAYITGFGNHPLSRTHLFLPGKKPINVIVPDNAWELGFNIRDGVFGLSRRDVSSIINGKKKRFETILYPNGGIVEYDIHFEKFTGSWQQALTIAFQQRKIYDKPSFDDAMYRREDLNWIRSAYVMHLVMAWDKEYPELVDFAKRGKELYGGDDVICLWPTWPTLGVDPRNQFDMYRDLPGGLSGIRSMADSLHALGVKFFIAYNPWDTDTKKEDHMKGLSALIRETNADGVVLDTKGESSKELQQAADDVKPGVIMYSEGMAVAKDMEGIVSGRVHNALYYPPLLNLNKLINPQFAIFRVDEVNKEPIQREYAVAFFNGYGTEINQFAPGHPSWEKEQYRYLKRTTEILRSNSKVFTDGVLTPIVETKHDSIWVNKWEGKDKTVYTVFSLKPEGFAGQLFSAKARDGYHFVDLWNHKEIRPGYVETNAFHKKYLGTNNEGEVGCVAELPTLIEYQLKGWKLSVKGNNIRINGIVTNEMDLQRYEGDVVIQIFDGKELLDETIVTLTPGVPRLISEVVKATSGSSKSMILVKGGSYHFKPTPRPDEFIAYPKTDTIIGIKSFYIDKNVVTNSEFRKFNPAANIPDNNEPVVNISLEEAQAYAKSVGKRLPTEAEWQYAAEKNPGIVGPVWQLTSDVYQSGSYTYIMMKGRSSFHPQSSWWYVQQAPKDPRYRQYLLRVSPGFERNSTVGFRCVKDLE